MARPSQAVRNIRKKIEKKQLTRQLKKSRREAKRKQRRKSLRSKTAPARIEAKATKQELGELKETIGDAVPTDSIGSTLKGSAKMSLSGAKTAAKAVDSQLERTDPQEFGVDFGGDGTVDGFGGPSENNGVDLRFGGDGGGGPVDGMGGQDNTSNDEIRFL